MFNILKVKILLISFVFLFSSKAAIGANLVQVLEEALNTNVQISAARKNLEAQKEELDQLRALKLPTVSANFSGDADWNLENDNDSTSFSAGLIGQYVLFDGNLTDYQVLAESLRIEGLEAEFEGIKQKVIYEAIIAYLNVLRDTRLVDLSKKNVSVLQQQLNATISRFQLGELTRTDVAQAKAALEAATSILASREGILYLANHSFEMAVGIKPSDLDTNIRLPSLPKSEAEAKGFATKFSLELKANAISEKRANYLLKASQSKRWPTLQLSTSLSAGETAAHQDFSNFGFSLTGSIPIYKGGSLKSGERKAQANLELSMINAEQSRLRVEQAVVAAWSDYEVSSAIIIARTREVEATQLAYQGTLEETRLGARTILDVLNAEQTVMNAETDLETARSSRLAAGFRVLLETGTLTASTLGIDSLND